MSVNMLKAETQDINPKMSSIFQLTIFTLNTTLLPSLTYGYHQLGR